MSDKSDGFNKEKSDKLRSKYGSGGMFSTGLGGLLHGVGFPLGVTLSDDDSCDGDGGSLSVP